MNWPRTAVVLLAAALASAGSETSAQPSLMIHAKAEAFSSNELRSASQTFRPTPASPIDEGAWYPLTVTGGRAALDALGVPRSLDLGSTMVELVRRLHLSASPAAELNAKILDLSLAVTDLGKLQNAVAAATSAGQRPTLAMAAQRDRRKRLEAALAAAGLTLREDSKQFVVEAETGDREIALRARLKTVGVDVEAIRLRLIKGEPFEFTVPTLELPLPLSPRAWTARILGRTVPPSELFTAILSDRRARLLYHGLVGMDANTRRWISNQRELLKHLYRDEESVRSFSLFGAAIKVAEGRMVVPGGPLAARRWATLLNADPARPDRFIRQVFDEESGRLAGLYFTAAGVDEPRRQFILGLTDSVSDGDARFKQLASGFANCYPKQSTTYPFFLRSYDAALLLTQIGLTDKGVLAGPRRRKFWELALSGDSLPENPAEELREVAGSGSIDAAWLVAMLCDQNLADRGGAYETLLFGHRVFSNTSERELPDQLVAVRARRLYPAVVMAIEQAGIKNSRIYARLAQHADRIGRVDDPARAIMATQQFQGALALTIGTTRAQTVTLETGEALLESLAAVVFENERYHGRLATWLARSWVPAIRAVQSGTGPSGTIEQGAALALAGRATATETPISWEGLQYVVDFAGMTRRRLDAVRAHEGGVTLDSVLELERIVSALQQNTLNFAQVRVLRAELRLLGPKLTIIKPAEEFANEGVDVARAVEDALRDLERIDAPNEVQRAAEVGKELAQCLDFVTGHVLAAWAYAPHVGEADGPALVGGDPALRHQFGVRIVGRQKLIMRWTVNRFGNQDAKGISGSLLGLEATLAKWSVRRLTSDAVPIPTLGGNDMSSFLLTVALSDGRRLTDASRDQIRAAIAAGMSAVEKAREDAEALDALAAKAVMSPWTRQVISWMVATESGQIPARFSAAELARIGGLVPSTVHEWGTASLLSGCLCVQMPEGRIPELVVGRAADGLIATQSADVMLRIAWILADLKLPASLASPVIAYAMRDFIDRVTPAHTADFEAFVRQARAIDQGSIEDYLGAIAAVGPLRPVSQERQ